MVRGVGTFFVLLGLSLPSLGFYLLADDSAPSYVYVALHGILVILGLFLASFGLARRTKEREWRDTWFR